MLESLFKVKSNDQLRADIKQWYIWTIFSVVIFVGCMLYVYSVLPEGYAIIVHVLMYMLFAPALLAIGITISEKKTALQIQTMRQEISSTVEWHQMNVNRCVVAAEHNIIEEIRMQALKDGKRVRLRSRFK